MHTYNLECAGLGAEQCLLVLRDVLVRTECVCRILCPFVATAKWYGYERGQYVMCRSKSKIRVIGMGSFGLSEFVDSLICHD